MFKFKPGKKLVKHWLGRKIITSLPAVMDFEVEIRSYDEIVDPNNDNIGVCVIISVLYTYDDIIRRHVLYFDINSKEFTTSKGKEPELCITRLLTKEIVDKVMEIVGGYLDGRDKRSAADNL